jgi:serine protease Do
MKKFFTFFAVFVLGGLMFYGITLVNTTEKHDQVLQEYDLTPVRPAAFYNSPPAIGPDFREAADKTIHAVVHIRSQFIRKSPAYDDFFGALREYLGYERRPNRTYPISGWGSGVIISPDGYIVTNNHVVEGAEMVEVILNDKRVFEGSVIGLDPRTDLALLKIDAGRLPTIEFGNSDEVMVGEWVLAVGNPFNLTSTVTAGIVSAKARNINILGSPGSIESFIQTDAAVNRGNSGGALVNNRGELVGINAAIASNTGYYQGYSFAIPVNIVKKVVADMKEYGEVQRAFLGVVIREIDHKFAAELGLKSIEGVFVDGLVEGGGAMESGIRIGDIILAVNNYPVNSMAQLLEIIGQYNPGNTVDVLLLREGRQVILDVELRTEDGTTAIISRVEEFYNERLGATLSRLPIEEMQRLKINSGLRIKDLDDGLLSRGGIREGFVIITVNGYAVDSRTGLESALNENSDRVRISGMYPNGMRVTFEFGL